MHKALLTTAISLPFVTAWGTEVHNQIGFMAEAFLTPQTTTTLQQILEPQYQGSIGRAAAWADGYAHTPAGRFSYQWHWIDTHDDPPNSCALNYAHDCKEGGCVISAIANQTQILRSCVEDVQSGALRDGANLTCSYALKWVSHFIGDLAQPLHVSGNAAGGNRVKAIFGGVHTELHAIWDHFIPYLDANVTHFSHLSIDPFFASLVQRIKADLFYEPSYLWLACSDPLTAVECAVAWARESNRWTCDYVYAQLGDNETDLATSGYAVGAYPIVELQISKAALRLATWLNRIVEGSAGKGEQMEL